MAIVTGATVYLMRLLADRRLPMNEGLLEPVDLVVPAGLLDPRFTRDPQNDPAVCAGNTETSQRIVDTLLLASSCASAAFPPAQLHGGLPLALQPPWPSGQ